MKHTAAPTQETTTGMAQLSRHALTVNIPLRDISGTDAQRCTRASLEAELTALSLSRVLESASRFQVEDGEQDFIEAAEDTANLSRLVAALIVASRDYTDAAHFPEPEPLEA